MTVGGMGFIPERLLMMMMMMMMTGAHDIGAEWGGSYLLAVQTHPRAAAEQPPHDTTSQWLGHYTVAGAPCSGWGIT